MKGNLEKRECPEWQTEQIHEYFQNNPFFDMESFRTRRKIIYDASGNEYQGNVFSGFKFWIEENIRRVSYKFTVIELAHEIAECTLKYAFQMQDIKQIYHDGEHPFYDENAPF